MATDVHMGNHIVEKIILAGRTVEPTILRSEIATIVATENPNSATLLYVISKIAPESWTALRSVPDFLMPYVQAKIAEEETAAADRFGQKATWLARWAVLFALIQAGCAAASLYLQLHVK